MKIANNVLKFATSEKLSEQFVDYWKHYQATQAGKKVDYDTTISFAEKEAQLNSALRKEIMKRANVNYATEANIDEWFNHPLVAHEVFAVSNALIDMILPDSIIDTIGLYTDVRVGGWGDSFAFDIEPRDLFVVSKHGKAQRSVEVKKQFRGQVTIIPEFRELSVAVSMYGVLTGKESLANYVAKCARSIETQMSIDAYNAFATAMTALSNTATTGLRIAGYSQANLIRLCEQVGAWSLGAKPIVIGTATALLNVLPDDANYRYTLSDPYTTIGYIPTINGYDVMRMPQVADLDTFAALKIAQDRLWIVAPSSQKIVKLCLEGNTISNTSGVFDNANLSQTSTMTKSWGVGIATNAIAGVITL
jgi:hypothetical protein